MILFSSCLLERNLNANYKERTVQFPVTLSYTKISFSFLKFAQFPIIHFPSTLQKKMQSFFHFCPRIFPALICSGLRILSILFFILLIQGSILFIKAHQAYSYLSQVCSALGDSRLCD